MPDAAAYNRAVEAARRAALRITAQTTDELVALLQEYADELAERVAAGLASRSQERALAVAREIIRELTTEMARITGRNVRLSAKRVAEIHSRALATVAGPAGSVAAAELGGVGVTAAQAVLARPELAASFRSIRRESIEAVDRILRRAIARGSSADKLAKELRAHILGADAFPRRLLLDRRRIGYAAIRELGYEPTPENLAAVRADVGRVADRARLIARTEPMNAEHEVRVRAAADSGVIATLQWRTSNARPPGHPGAPCIVCRILQEVDWFGLGPGVYDPRAVPSRPHPRCLCRTVSALRQVAEWGQPRGPVPTLVVAVSDVVASYELSPSQEAMLERALDAATADERVAA